MSYIQNEQVNDGQKLVESGDINDPSVEPTEGLLSHGSARGIAKPLQLDKDLRTLVNDRDVAKLLAMLLQEFREFKFLFIGGMKG